MTNRKRTLWISLCVVLIAAFMFGAYYIKRGGEQQGAKQITLVVVGAQGDTLLDETYHTDAQTLAALLEEKELVQFTDSSFGRYIIGVCGVTADDSVQQWWHIGQNGEDAMTGADELVIVDGDRIVLTLKTGY